MHSVCIVEIHDTVNNIKILTVAQNFFVANLCSWQNKKYLGLNVKCLIFLLGFNQI
jgi:hypothetical protein